MAQHQIAFKVHAAHIVLGLVPNIDEICEDTSAKGMRTHENHHKIDHNSRILSQSQIVLTMHQASMLLGHGTKYEENPSSHHGGMNEYRTKCMKKMDIITKLWYKAKFYFSASANRVL